MQLRRVDYRPAHPTARRPGDPPRLPPPNVDIGAALVVLCLLGTAACDSRSGSPGRDFQKAEALSFWVTIA